MINELGTSTGFASNPYPGSTLVSAPGLIAAETNTNPPGYPFIAQSSAPSTPSASAEGGLLTANSTANASTATAYVGAPAQVNGVGYLSATATAKLGSDGGVTAQAVDDAQDIELSGVLHIGAVRSEATLVVGPHGTSKPSAQTTVSGATIAGVAVNIGSDGIALAGKSQPLPGSSPITAPLAAAGITVTVLKPSIGPAEVLSGALVVTVSQHGDTHTFTFGRADAEVQAASGAAGPAGPGGTGSFAPVGSVSPGVSSVPYSSSGAGSAAGMSARTGNSSSTASSPALAGGALSSGVASGTTAGSGASPLTGSAPSNPAGAGTSVGGGSLVAFSQLDDVGLFVLVVVAAGVVLGGSLLVRIYAVRHPWTS